MRPVTSNTLDKSKTSPKTNFEFLDFIALDKYLYLMLNTKKNNGKSAIRVVSMRCF